MIKLISQKYHFFITVLILLFINYCKGAVIKGRVHDSENHVPMKSVDIYIIDIKNIGVQSDSLGNFELKNVPLGEHKLVLSYIGFQSIHETIIINKTDELLYKEYYMKTKGGKIEVTLDPALEKYHSELDNYAKCDSLIQLSLDSLFYCGNELWFKLSFTNLSKLIVYIPLVNDCWSVFTPIIHNSKGNIIENNCIDLGCDIPGRYYPDYEDIITLPPQEQCHYPKTKIRLIDFSALPKDEYEVKIIYSYHKPEYISKFLEARTDFTEVIEALNMIVRGVFYTNNALYFNN